MKQFTVAGGEVIMVDVDPIGAFISEWRLRRVTIYQDAQDADMVVAVGLGFNGGSDATCHEPRSSYKNEIGRFNTRYK